MNDLMKAAICFAVGFILLSCTEDKHKVASPYGFDCTSDLAISAQFAIYRCVNKEAVCYVRSSGGISCNWETVPK